MVQLAIEDQIYISRNLIDIPVRTVVPYYQIVFEEEEDGYSESYFNESADEHRILKKWVSSLDDIYDCRYGTGAFRIELQHNRELKNWLLSLLTKTNIPTLCFEGIFLSQSEDEILQVLEHGSEKNTSIKKRWFGIKYPSRQFPNTKELVIQKCDIEKFEHALSANQGATKKEARNNPPAKQKQRESYLKLWLRDNSQYKGTLVDLHKREVWEQLILLSSELFSSSAKNPTVDNFFKKQKYI